MTIPYTLVQQSGILRGDREPDSLRDVAGTIAISLSMGFAIATSPMWFAAVAGFVAAHPSASATAVWEVAKALKEKKDPVEAGVKAGLDIAVVSSIEELIKRGVSSSG